MRGSKWLRAVSTAIVLVVLLGVAGPASAPAEESEQILCEADSCQPLPPPPVDPTITTVFPGPGNPPVHYVDHRKCGKGSVRRHGRCVRKHRGRHHHRGHR